MKYNYPPFNDPPFSDSLFNSEPCNYIAVYPRFEYGWWRFYPRDPGAEVFAKFAGTESLTRDQLKIVEHFGFLIDDLFMDEDWQRILERRELRKAGQLPRPTHLPGIVKSMGIAAVTMVNDYGNRRYYPKNDVAKALAKIAGAKTLTEDQLEDLKVLGFEVDVIRLTPAEQKKFRAGRARAATWAKKRAAKEQGPTP